MHHNNLQLLILLLVLALLPRHPAAAAGDPAPAEPIRIEADRMESYRQRHTVNFAGKVIATQADLVIHADEMTVAYEPPPSEQSPAELTRQIDTIQGHGNVRIIKEGWEAVADELRYSTAEQKVELTGNARAWQDKNMVSGDTIILYLDEGKSVVEHRTGGGERVKAFIYPEADGDSP